MTTIDGRRGVLGKNFAVAHTGLLLDKMLQWGPASNARSEEERAKSALRTLHEAATRTPVPEGYPRAFRQRQALLDKFVGGIDGAVTRWREAQCRGRLVVNLGAGSVRETNIALLHTWGVPYIPGSALKGLASASAHRSGAPGWKKRTANSRENDDRSDHEILFGDTDESGCVVFHDAWWCPDGEMTPLDLDTMTVHHVEYYGRRDVPPADWDEPNPISFLTTRGKFLLALTGPIEWVNAAFHWLEDGLNTDGIGAKTAAGYGRMSIEEDPSRKAERERLANEAERRQAVQAGISHEVARFTNASNARQVFEAILAFANEESLHEDVRRGLRDLYMRDRDFWREWLKRKASAEQIAAATTFGMVQVEVEDMPPARKPATQIASEATWEQGAAWVAPDPKNRLTLFFLLGGKDGKPSERNVKDVAFEDDVLKKALQAASQTAPVPVKVLRAGKKIAQVRRIETDTKPR